LVEEWHTHNSIFLCFNKIEFIKKIQQNDIDPVENIREIFEKLKKIDKEYQKILQDALMRSGISEKGGGGKTAKAGNTDNQDDNANDQDNTRNRSRKNEPRYQIINEKSKPKRPFDSGGNADVNEPGENKQL